MPSGNTTIKSRVNPSKFMGSSHAAGAELEERVSNNERKITLIKNILNYQDSLLPIPKPEEDDGDDSSNLNIADRLDNIGDALGVIGGLFKLQLSSLQDKEEQDRKAKADQDKRDREAALEAKKATKSKKKSPFQRGTIGFFDRLKKFFLNIAIGAAVLKAIEWLKSPENVAKVESFTKWLEDNAAAIFTTIGALATITAIAGVVNTIKGIWQFGSVLLAIGTNPFFWAAVGLIASMWMLSKLGLELAKAREERDNAVREALKNSPSTEHLSPGEIEMLVEGSRLRDTARPGDVDYKPSGGLFGGDVLQIKPGNRLDGGFGSGRFGAYFLGGRPPVGEVVTVGEKGRELFVADRSGTVVSNDKTEHVFNDGALLVAKSNTLDKISNISSIVAKSNTFDNDTSSIVAKSDTLSNKFSSISQRVNNKHGSSKIIDLRRGQQQGSTFTAGNATTGGQIEGVSSVFPGDILVKAAQVQLGLVG